MPFDYEPLFNSVKKTGKLIIGGDACERGSYLHSVASTISRLAFDYLDAPVSVVGAENWIVPPAELEDLYYPEPEAFIDAYHTDIKPLPGYEPSKNVSPSEYIKRAKYGIGVRGLL